jgi:hypothetical protein
MDCTSLPAATLTGHERPIVEAYVVVLDYESRLALCVEDGAFLHPPERRARSAEAGER